MKRPWGEFKVLKCDKEYWIKIITINPKQKTSMQYHQERDEQFFVLKGDGKVFRQTCETNIKEGDTFTVQNMTVHRLENSSKKEPLVLVEVATGRPSEKDIIRLDDCYGRKTEKREFAFYS